MLQFLPRNPRSPQVRGGTHKRLSIHSTRGTGVTWGGNRGTQRNAHGRPPSHGWASVAVGTSTGCMKGTWGSSRPHLGTGVQSTASIVLSLHRGSFWYLVYGWRWPGCGAVTGSSMHCFESSLVGDSRKRRCDFGWGRAGRQPTHGRCTRRRPRPLCAVSRAPNPHS